MSYRWRSYRDYPILETMLVEPKLEPFLQLRLEISEEIFTKVHSKAFPENYEQVFASSSIPIFRMDQPSAAISPALCDDFQIAIVALERLVTEHA